MPTSATVTTDLEGNGDLWSFRRPLRDAKPRDSADYLQSGHSYQITGLYLTKILTCRPPRSHMGSRLNAFGWASGQMGARGRRSLFRRSRGAWTDGQTVFRDRQIRLRAASGRVFMNHQLILRYRQMKYHNSKR